MLTKHYIERNLERNYFTCDMQCILVFIYLTLLFISIVLDTSQAGLDCIFPPTTVLFSEG